MDARTDFTSGSNVTRDTEPANIDSEIWFVWQFRVDRPQLANASDVPRIELQRQQREWLTTCQQSLVRGHIQQTLTQQTGS